MAGTIRTAVCFTSCRNVVNVASRGAWRTLQTSEKIIMYRRLLLSLYQTRSRAIYTRELSALTSKCDTATLPFRAANGVGFRTLGTTSTTYCEHKEGSLHPKKDTENIAEKDAESEAANVGEKKEAEPHEEARMTGVSVESVVEIKTEEENVIQLRDETTNVSLEGAIKHEENKNIDSEKLIEVQMEAETVTQLRDEIQIESLPEATKHEENKQTDHEEQSATAKMETENVTQVQEEIENINFQEVTEKIEVAEVKMDAENVIRLADEMTSGLPQKATEHKEAMGAAEETAPVVKTEVSETELPRVQKAEGLKHQTVEPVKNVKESLLDLLGAMKVEVTTMRKFKDLKVHSKSESLARPKPAKMESTMSMLQEAIAPTPAQSESTEMKAAVSAVASTLPNPGQAQSELLRQLKQHEALADAQKTGDVTNIGNIIADMKVGKRPSLRQNAWSTNQIRFDEDDKSTIDSLSSRRSLFSGKRMNIFNLATENKPDEADAHTASPTLWDIELANTVALSADQKPRNGLEEMIKWTREGKLWQYPINNEAGLEEEASVPFHEHVFLEKHLEDGFPRQGPVRHFMELVLVGLSHNPHLTVSQKEQHIAWFRDYFQQKEEVLKESEVYLN